MIDANKSKGKIVVIDDDLQMRSLLEDFLGSLGFQVASFSRAKEALEKLKKPEEHFQSQPELIISDIKMPEMDGMTFLTELKKAEIDTPVILATAFGSIESAISAMKKGAFDYVVKPFKLVELEVIIDRALNFDRIQNHNKTLRSEMRRKWEFSDLIGKSQPMQNVFDLIKRVAQAKANILIQGESGTGKEMIARAVHNSGPRAEMPFVAINCAAIPENLLESELFGHARGSFTGAVQKKKGLFEEADGGTLFLDEIGDMNLTLQAKILRVIQEKKVRAVGENQDKVIDVRIIAATHRDLKQAIKDGHFREDLFYRLSVIPVLVPPLRDRPEDIPLLAEFFLKKYAAANNSKVRGFDKAALSKLMSLNWEGNVRELENLIERTVVLTEKSFIEAQDIPSAIQRQQREDPIEFNSNEEGMQSLEDLEKKYIQLVLKKTGGKKEVAAQILGINRRTLYRKEREYQLIQGNGNSSEHSLGTF